METELELWVHSTVHTIDYQSRTLNHLSIYQGTRDEMLITPPNIDHHFKVAMYLNLVQTPNWHERTKQPLSRRPTQRLSII